MGTNYIDSNARGQRINHPTPQKQGVPQKVGGLGGGIAPQVFYNSGGAKSDASNTFASKPAAREAGYKKP